MGEKYLCYLVQVKLYLLKLDVKENGDFSVTSTPTFINAKDATPLEVKKVERGDKN